MSLLLGCFSVFLSVYAHWLLCLIFAPGLIIGGKYSCDTASFWFLNFYLFRYPYNRISLFFFISLPNFQEREWYLSGFPEPRLGAYDSVVRTTSKERMLSRQLDQVPSTFYLFPTHLLHPAPLSQVLHFNPARIISLITYNSLVIYFTSTEIWSSILYQISTNYDLQSRDLLREHYVEWQPDFKVRWVPFTSFYKPCSQFLNFLLLSSSWPVKPNLLFCSQIPIQI